MKQSFTILAGLSALVAAGCSGQTVAPSTSHQVAAGSACTQKVADKGADLHREVYDVKPVYRDEFRARALVTEELAGARMYVPAEEGMTEQYLHRMAACHAVSGEGNNSSDPLQARGIEQIEVDAANGSYSIAVISENEAAAEEIWQRAEMLNRGGSVQVEQVSAAPSHRQGM